MKKQVFVLLALASTVFLLGCQANIPTQEQQAVQTEFILGFIPTESANELTPKAEKLTQFLTEQMGMPVKAVIPTNYEALIEALKFNQLDASFMDSSPSWLAHQRADAEVVLAEVKDGSPYYYAEMFVRSDSDITELSQLTGKRIAFTSMTGSSGFIFPIGEMINQGLVNPTTEDFAGLEKALSETFETHTISGGYKQSLQLLLDDKVDVVGGAHYAPSEFLSTEDQAKIKTLVRLGKSPSHPVMVRNQLDPTLREKFVNAMLELNKPENIAILNDLYGVDGFVKADTQSHLGDLVERFEAVTGIQQKVLDKKS